MWNFLATPKNTPILYIDLIKDPKCIDLTPKYSPILWWPPKISTESSYQKKIFIFLKTPKNIEIQNFQPKKWPKPTYVWKYQSTPPPPPWG